MTDDYDELRKEHDAKLRSLGGFLESENRSFDLDERRALNPILNSLRKDTQRYTDRELLGEGGEKRIFKVRDTSTDRIVAMARPRARSSDEDKEEFLREARLTACLQHPNILTIHDQGVDEEGVPFFVMELVRGEDLKDIVDGLRSGEASFKTRYPRERLIEIFIKVCDAISYAHSRGVVHLDVKPANIKVGPFGEVLVCDWGLSRILTSGFDADVDSGLEGDYPNSDLLNDLAPSGLVKGTPGFIAPEQADGTLRLTERTDVYSLGALLYYLLSFREPVSGGSPAVMLEHTTKGNVGPLNGSALEQAIPKGLEAVVMKALSLHPESRYGSVRALREELDRHVLGFPTKAQKASLIVRMTYLFKRRPAVFFVSGFSLLLLVCALAVSSIQIEQSRREAVEARDLARENLRLYEEEAIRSKSFDDNMRSAALSLQNQETFLDATGKEQLLEFQLKEGNASSEERAEMANRLGMLHFVRQRFKEAVIAFESGGVDLEDNAFYGLALEYEAYVSAEKRWLDPSQLRDIVLGLSASHDKVCYAMAFYYFRGAEEKGSPESLLPLVESLLDRLNHRGRIAETSDSLRLRQTENGLSLSLSGSGYSVLHVPLPVFRNNSNLLRPLKLYSLDVSGGLLLEMSQLLGSGIKELNIANIRALPDAQLARVRQLELDRLVHSLEISDQRLNSMLPGVELIRVEGEGGA